MSGASRFDALPKHEQAIALRCLEWALSPAAAKVDLGLAVKLRRASRAPAPREGHPAGATDDELLLMAYRLVVQGYAKAGAGSASSSTTPPPSKPSSGTATSSRATRAPAPAIAVLEEPLVRFAAQVLEADLVAAEEGQHRPPRRRRSPPGEGRRRQARGGRRRWR